jgi:small-conductance mechanosensitive channel
MKEFRRLVVVIPAVVLVFLLAVLYWKRESMEQLAFLRKGSGGQTGLVDQRPYRTAQTLGALAVSAEEQNYAQAAERLADHEVDQAFAMALRQASMARRMLTGDAERVANRVEELKLLVKEDQAKVDALEASAKTSGVAPAEGDELDIAKAQLGLDSDELTDATGDLARETGDRRGEIQQELATREAAMKKVEGQAKEPAAVNAKRYSTLWGRGDAWFDQRNRARLIAQAREQAEGDAATLEKQHGDLEKNDLSAGADTSGGSARVARLKSMANQRVLMSILDDRIATERQLANTYLQWEKQVWMQHRMVTYLVLESFAWIATIVLAAAMLGMLGRLVLRRLKTDARRTRTLETLLLLGAEGVGLIGVLLVIFGVPQQMPTILGLATAGLTVVFQDYILAFCGWFVLMGRNGVRVCDWVEIDGVGGEVAEIGLFRTTLLETGNWTSRGHPTGRKVRFTNSYAIRGRYFNFSTHGQWMWDEIKLNVPATADAYEVVQRMQAAVEKETATNSEQAEREWQTATRQNGLSQFTAKPTVDLRPTEAAGVDVIIRFVTRASERFELRNRIYVALLGLMEGTERPSLAKAI